MAQGLPVVASPQQAYLEAIGDHGGGFIACDPSEWQHALTRLIQDHVLRSDMGVRAQKTVAENYGTHVVAKRYVKLFATMLDT